MLSLVLKGPADGSKGLSQRKDVGRDPQVWIVGSHRMPIDSLRGYGDLRDEIGTRERDAWMQNMRAALDEVELEPAEGAALKALFERASAYLVNTGASRAAAEIAHPEVSRRWEAQLALDEAVAAIRRRDAARAIALADHANPAAFTALLGEMEPPLPSLRVPELTVVAPE